MNSITLAHDEFIMLTVTHEAMKRSSTSLPTSSSQNQSMGSFQSQLPCSFENQPLRRQRKCGIAAETPPTCQMLIHVSATEGLQTKCWWQDCCIFCTTARPERIFSKDLAAKGRRSIFVVMCHGRYGSTNNSWSNDTIYILEAAIFDASATGFCQEVVCYLVFAFFCTLSQYLKSLENIDNEYAEMWLSSQLTKHVSM